MNKPLIHYVSDATREALEATGLAWTLEMGSRHVKVKIEGRLAGILPKNGGSTTDLRPEKNQVATIRRIARDHGVEAPAKPLAKPKPVQKAKAVTLAPVAPAAFVPWAEVPAWRPNTPTPPLRGEPGWTGKFTRETAPGALPSGTRVVKQAGAWDEKTAFGAHGTVLGSVVHPTKPARLYFVEWDDRPKVAMAVMGRKIGKLKA